ncbi:MAG TPA: glycine cleavage system protein GcvH [Candidatus Thermoplasmatota archaeon]|nr:glycine cleavage system protein GcvH [Candidatus Thermoplasmatota archaeon]
MSKTPDDLRYTESHEWVRIEGDVATIGITDHAQEALNDIVYVELPKKGVELPKGKEFGVVESVKSVSDLYMPLSGKVVDVNGELEDEPEMLNEDPYGKGWIIRVKLSKPEEADELWDAKRYAATLG